MNKTRKANGQGYTYKNGNSYRTVIQYHGRTITASAKSAQESRRLAREKLSLLPRTNSGLILKQNKTSLGEYLSEWLEKEHKNHIAHTTYKRYKSLLTQHIAPCIGEVLLQKLSPAIISNFLSAMRESGQGARSQQQARAFLSVALKNAEQLEIIDNNPVRKVRNPSIKSTSMKPLNIEEVRALLNTYSGTYLSARLHIAVLYGLRQGEALGLRWRDIDFEKKMIAISQQMQLFEGKPVFAPLKTEKSRRTIFFDSQTELVLIRHRDLISRLVKSNPDVWSDMDLVFPGKNGGFRSPKSDYCEWKQALKICGIPHRRLHDARHTAATLLYSQGVGIETISRALGHSSSAITSRLYVHSAEAPLRKAAEALSELLGKD